MSHDKWLGNFFLVLALNTQLESLIPYRIWSLWTDGVVSAVVCESIGKAVRSYDQWRHPDRWSLKLHYHNYVPYPAHYFLMGARIPLIFLASALSAQGYFFSSEDTHFNTRATTPKLDQTKPPPDNLGDRDVYGNSSLFNVWR